MSINELEIILELKDRKEAYLKLVKLYINSDIEFKKYINNRWDLPPAMSEAQSLSISLL